MERAGTNSDRAVTGRDRSRERGELVLFAAVIVALHLVGWGLAAFYARRYPYLVGLAGLAYSFGLRHAFDADHIAAIDNTTRKLMTPERRPFGVGFFFSLGHSTVVFLMTVAVAVAARSVTAALPSIRVVGSSIGTTISGVFLCVIGLLNLVVLADVYRVFRAMRRGDANAAELESMLWQRGFLSRWLGGVFQLIGRPADMYWVGLLFGLGFDTATEVALMTTAGVAASQALPVGAVLALPIVFAAGMSLLDSADGVLMCGAYGWAFANPLRKVFYNLTITGLSVVVALVVGAIELVSIVSDHLFERHTGVWGVVQSLDFQTMGVLIVGLFVISWLTSLAVWRFARLDQRS